MDDRGNEGAGASFTDHEAEGLFSLDRREVVVGLAAGAVLATTPVGAASDSIMPDIRLVRNPEKHDEIGVAIDFGQVPDDVAIVFYARNMAAKALPQGFVDGKKALDKLDRFVFDGVHFSDNRGVYRLEFSFALVDAEWKVSASFIRKGQRKPTTSIEQVKLAEFAKGKAELQFNLDHDLAELFRWDLFGERLEVKGRGAQLGLKLASLAPPRGSPSPWSEAQLRFSLSPSPGSSIWAIKGTVSINRLEIRQTRGDQADGSRIQENQEFEKLKKEQSYRADAWLGEATELAWLFPTAPPATMADSKTVLRLVPEEYRIVDIDEARLKPVIAITHDAPPTKLTLRQWRGNARATVAALRAPLKVTILSPREAGKSGPPAAVFHLADALLTRQDVSKSLKPATGLGDVPDEEIEEALSGRLRENAFAVDTVHGTFIVEGDPPPKPEDQPKNSGDKPGSTKSKAAEQKPGPPAPANAQATKSDQADQQKSAFGQKLNRPSDFADRPEKGLTQFQLRARGGDIFFFDARALLRQICVALPDAIPRPETDNTVGWSKRESAVWSRLDFDGSEIAFRMDLPEDPKNPDTFRYRRAWPSARGVVTLCEMPRPFHDLSTVAKTEANPANTGTSKEPKGTSKEPKKAETKPENPAPVMIALDGARLRARRDSDNLALTFQFVRMVLELGRGGGRIVANAELSGGGTGQTAKGADPARKFDDRPLLIVNFPPQHVAEMAYYRQINDGVTLPDVLGHLRKDEKFVDDLKEWRKAPPGSAKDEIRKKIFDRWRPRAAGEAPPPPPPIPAPTPSEEAAMRGLQEIVDLTKDGGSEADWQSKLGLDPAPFKDLWNRWEVLPLDQRQYYLGSSAEAMDPDVRKVLLNAWRSFRAANPDVARPGADEEKAESKFQELLVRLPDVDLSADVENDVEQRLSVEDHKDDPKRPDDRKGLPADRTERIIKEKMKRSRDFALVSEKYAAPDGEAPRPAKLAAKYSGREDIRKVWKTEKDSRSVISKFVGSVADRYEKGAFGKEEDKEKFRPITPARLSGPSRLVFRFDPAGGGYDDPDRDKRSSLGEDKEQVRAIHFSFEGLTDWGRFDLAVTRRAETLELQPGGRVPHASMRALDLDPQKILLHQGIQPGRSIDGRMRDILASLQPPGQNETAIELPFRLVLSPDQFGRFRTRRTIVPGVVRETKPKPDHDEQLTELWTANLQIGAAKPVVRAIWSDDFLPSALDNGSSPVRGPHAPWDVPAKGVAGAGQFRTALDAYDRHEIVALSSVYGLPAMGRRNELNNLIDGSQFEPPKTYKLDKLKHYDIGGGRTDDLSGIYNPSALNISELRLTALGGSLRHDTTFIPPASAIRLRDKKEENIFEAFTIERWRQITVLGRDIEVEVVYKGFLFPLGVRATLVKLTERRFVRVGKGGPVTAFLVQRKFIRIGKKTKEYPAVGEADKGRRFPVSELTMLTLETPDIVDPDILDDQAMTAALKTVVPGKEKLGFRVRPNGTIDFTTDSASKAVESFLPGLCFWPRVRPSEAGNINFEFRIENDAAPVRMPLIFVDNRAANNQDVMTALTAYYNGTIRTDTSSGDNLTLRTVRMGGASRRYADENQDGECHFETFSWEVRGEGRAGKRDGDATDAPNAYFASDPLLQGSDQPPFYPYIHRARVRVGQAERFIGRPLEPQWVRFNDDYRSVGFKDTEGYLEIVAAVEKPKDVVDDTFLPLDMGEAGDRSGGIGRPAMNVKFLSRRYGLLPSGNFVPKAVDGAPPPQTGQPAPEPPPSSALGEPPPPPPPPKFDLSSFFNSNAKLLGLLTFTELLEKIAGSAMPELKEQVDAATEKTAGYLKQTVLPQIERSLKSLEQMWETAQRKLTSQAVAAGDVVRLDINEIYPDIAPALKNLLGKVKQAQTASGLDLISAMSEVQTSGRKFVTAVTRTLADPITPLREDLRGQFRQISIEINKFGSGLSALIEVALDGIKKKLVDRFKEDIADKLPIEKITPFTRLVLSLPVPDNLNPGLTDAEQFELANRLDQALAKGVIKLAVTVIASGKLAEDDVNEALVGAVEEAKSDLVVAGASAKVAEALTAYKEQAEKLKKEVNDTADEARQQVIRRVKGAFYPELFGTLGLISELKRQFESLVREIKAANGRDILETTARHVGAAMKAMLTELILSEASELCNKLAEDMAKLADQVLMPAKETADRADIGKLQDTVLKFVSAFPLESNATADANKLKEQYNALEKRAKAAIERYRGIRSHLTESGLQDVCKVAPEKSVIAVQLAGELNELMALKQVVGQWVVTALKLCEQNLTDKIKRTELNSQSIWELFKTAFDSSNPKKEVDDLIRQLAGFVGATDAVRTAWTNVIKIVREMSAGNAAVKDALATVEKEIAPFPAVLERMQAVIRLAEDKDPLDAMRVAIVALDGVKDRASDQLYMRISSSLRTELEKKDGAQELYAFIFDPNERARGIVRIVDGADRQLRSLLGKAITTVPATRKAIIETIGRAAAPFFVALNHNIYQNVEKLRVAGQTALAPGADPNKSALQQIVAKLLKVLKGPNGQPLQSLFTVPDTDGQDKLKRDIERVDRLANFPKTGTDADINTYVADLAALADDWTKGTAAPLVLLNNLRAVLAAVLKGDLAQFVDLHLIRQQVDQAIRTMVPARVNRSFDLKIKVKDLGKLVLFEGKESNAKALGLPKQHPKGIPLTLVLRATGVVDLLEPKNSTFDAEGYLPGFALQLLPSFDVVTFSFPPTTFTAGLGKPFHVSLKVEDVKLGDKVKFLQDIQSILPAPKSGKGFFIRMLKGRGSLGIVAGYALPISPITIGNMFIDQLSLNVAAELPFDKGDARFVMSVSRPEAPFVIAVAPYAGAGHFGLIANPKGIVGFEASFQFGGGGGFSFGPLTGKGRISVGVFVRKLEGLTELYGIFYVGGSARIACFAVGAELYVRLSHQGGDMAGEAIFTFTFSIGIKDIEYSVTVFKRESGSSSKSESSLDNGKTIDLAADEFREVYAQATPGTPAMPIAGTSLKCARLVNATSCKAEDFDVYRSYFSHPGIVRKRPKRAKSAKPLPPVQPKDKGKQGAAAAPKPKPSAKGSAWVMT
jgi:hypothetical protein